MARPPAPMCDSGRRRDLKRQQAASACRLPLHLNRAQGWVRRFKKADGMYVIVDYRIAEEVVYGLVEFKLENDDDE